MMWALADARRWTDVGTQLLDEELSVLAEGTMAAPSGLPGWTRKHLTAHIIGNAVALGNLVHWAATGSPTPMYSSPQQRQADIDAGAVLSAQELVQRFGQTAMELTQGMDLLTSAQWAVEVVTAQGRTVPATVIPWLRAREVMVHAVDLRWDITFRDLPEDFLLALCRDIQAKRNSPAVGAILHDPVRVIAEGSPDEEFLIAGEGEMRIVRGDLPGVAAYLAGRRMTTDDVAADDGKPVPGLPPWL